MKIRAKIKNAYSLGQILQQSRMEQGFSQRELAAMLGVSQKWIWEMEQGKPGILMSRLFKMLDENGVTLFAEFKVEDWEKK